LSLKLDLNSICKYVFDKSFDSEQTMFTKINNEFSLDITLILLSMIRALMNNINVVPVAAEVDEETSVSSVINSFNNDKKNVTKDYPIILLQIFRFMYHNCDDFRTMASNTDFLSAITATLYPYHDLTESQAATPLVEVKVK
jgi:hypothetical protein